MFFQIRHLSPVLVTVWSYRVPHFVVIARKYWTKIHTGGVVCEKEKSQIFLLEAQPALLAKRLFFLEEFEFRWAGVRSLTIKVLSI